MNHYKIYFIADVDQYCVNENNNKGLIIECLDRRWQQI